MTDAIWSRLSKRTFDGIELMCMATGSTVYGDDKANDIDWICLATEDQQEKLVALGWKNESEEIEYPDFDSLRKGDTNLILSSDLHFLADWITAHDECCEKRPKTREERIAIFRAYLYGEPIITAETIQEPEFFK